MHPKGKPDDLSEREWDALLAVAYGEGGWRNRRRLRRAARRNAQVRPLLAAHRAIAAAVRALPPDRAPADLADRAWSQIQAQEDRTGRTARARGWNPAAAMALVGVALALLWGGHALRPSPEPAPGYSQAEVEEARRQIEAALGRVHRQLAMAGHRVREEVLAPKLARPIRDGRDTLQELFGKEKTS